MTVDIINKMAASGKTETKANFYPIFRYMNAL